MCIDVSRVICSIAIILLILFSFLSYLMKLKTQTTGILKTRVLKKCYELLWLRDTDCSDTRHMEPDIKLFYSVDHNFKAIILYALALDKPTTFLQNKTATPSGSHIGRDIIHMIWYMNHLLSYRHLSDFNADNGIKPFCNLTISFTIPLLIEADYPYMHY